jgi:hypothetical protein
MFWKVRHDAPARFTASGDAATERQAFNTAPATKSRRWPAARWSGNHWISDTVSQDGLRVAGLRHGSRDVAVPCRPAGLQCPRRFARDLGQVGR